MSNVVQFSLGAADRAAPSNWDLLLQTISLVVSLTEHAAEQTARIAALESRMPAPPFEIPAGWLRAKQASALCGYAPSSIYRFVRNSRIVGAPFGGNIFVDPASLPVKGSWRRQKIK
jgi:hypothetical protein